MSRANEKADFSLSILRSQINKDNQYGVFLKVELYEPWYRKFYNDYLKKGGAKCGACEFPFIHLVVFPLIPAGGREVENDCHIFIRFQLLTIPESIRTPQDVDEATIRYSVIVRDLDCMTYKSLCHVVRRSISDHSFFEESVYFHPNFGHEGFEVLKMIYETRHPNTDHDEPLPPFPDTPRFWTLGERGSNVMRWPPTHTFFDTWIATVARGEALQFMDDPLDDLEDPACSVYRPPSPPPVAGPSKYRSLSPAPNSYHPPVLTECPPTPITHPPTDPDIQPSSSHDLMGFTLKSPPGRSPSEFEPQDDSDSFKGFSDIGDDVLAELNQLELNTEDNNDDA
jgi:hypothetical protein